MTKEELEEKFGKETKKINRTDKEIITDMIHSKYYTVCYTAGYGPINNHRRAIEEFEYLTKLYETTH